MRVVELEADHAEREEVAAKLLVVRQRIVESAQLLRRRVAFQLFIFRLRTHFFIESQAIQKQHIPTHTNIAEIDPAVFFIDLF